MAAPIAVALDFANMVGGLFLARGLLRPTPDADGGIGRIEVRQSALAWVIGCIALVTGGMWLIVRHGEGVRPSYSAPIALLIGLVLLWAQRRARPLASGQRGPALLVATLGLIAILAGVQGLFTPAI